jgi:DNA-binding transcriptional MerR regulator
MESDDLRYTLNEAAVLCSCAPTTLTRFEKHGLFKARRDSRGTRWFSDRDVARLSKLLEERLARTGQTGLRRHSVRVVSTSTGEA